MPHPLTSFVSPLRFVDRVPFVLAFVLTCAGVGGIAGCNGGASGAHPSSSGSSGSSGSGGSITGSGCASLAAECAANQQGCVENAAGAKCEPCMAGTYAASTGTCTAIAGTPLTHDFPDQTTTSGQEQLGNCRSWTLNNATELWVNAVELVQNEDSHHSNWVFVPDSLYPGPDGIWPCQSRGYDFYKGVGAGGLLYAQSTQATHEVQRFPTGAAIHVPAHVRVVSDVHLLNTAPDSNTGHAKLAIYTLDPAAVTVKLKAFHVEYDALTIPPHATSRFTAECAVAADVTKATGTLFAPKVVYLLPHTHTLASGFFAKILGGPRDGETMLDLGTYNGEAHGHAFDPPIDMTGAQGIKFACTYTNPRAEMVGWGFGTQEMCELFGFADTTTFFQSSVGTGSSNGTEGAVQLFTGPCKTQVF